MSAILSADDLNDFISPGVACIKPVETLPKQQPPEETMNPYEVTTEEKVHASQPAPPAQISLTDCLACSGCVTSAEAVLVSLQSHSEVLETLDKYRETDVTQLSAGRNLEAQDGEDERILIASVSPQVRASLAATYNVSKRQAGNMISQLLSGQDGVRNGGRNGSGFTWVFDTNAMRDLCLVASADEISRSSDPSQKRPILSSVCPGWICYAEKTHPHIVPHLSQLKSPQALTGTLVKSILAKRFGVAPSRIWHLAIMPCFDKKLEASRGELTSQSWQGEDCEPIRDVDCVITARELLMLAESRNISFPCLPKVPVKRPYAPRFPDVEVHRLLSRAGSKHRNKDDDSSAIGTSGGYLHHVLKTQQAAHPGSNIRVQRGRNADVADYIVLDSTGAEVFRAARYYGFRNIQNLVRRLKPAKPSRMPGTSGTSRRPGGTRKPGGEKEGEYAYVEVMACPGGCTNGGGQVKVGDLATLRQASSTGIVNGGDQEMLPAQKEWLAKVDEAYWSASDLDDETESIDDDDDGADIEMSDATDSISCTDSSQVVDGIDHAAMQRFVAHWATVTGIDAERLLYTSFRVVESDVGKIKGPGAEMERVAGLAVQVGGGW